MRQGKSKSRVLLILIILFFLNFKFFKKKEEDVCFVIFKELKSYFSMSVCVCVFNENSTPFRKKKTLLFFCNKLNISDLNRFSKRNCPSFSKI